MSDRPERVFVDTNVLLYIASDDVAKIQRVEGIIRSRPVISVQVLNEIANVARRKLRMDWAETIALVSPMRGWMEVVSLTVAMNEIGLRLARRYQLSVYDGIILAAALESGCRMVYSEDMQNGLVVDGRLRIQNPFLN